jgi:hypothetical protein
MQPKAHSVMETCCNVGSGFIVSLIYWQLFVVPQVEGQELTGWLNISITLQFTVISIVRGYVWRRYFNGLLIKGRV